MSFQFRTSPYVTGALGAPLMWRLCNMAVTLTNVICKDIDFGVIPDSKVHGANMGPIWGRQDPGGPHVGSMNFAIWDALRVYHDSVMWIFCVCLIKLSFSWKSFVFKFLRFCTVVLLSDVCYRRSHDTYRFCVWLIKLLQENSVEIFDTGVVSMVTIVYHISVVSYFPLAIQISQCLPNIQIIECFCIWWQHWSLGMLGPYQYQDAILWI